MDYTVYLKYFIGLMAIINPIGLLPVFSSLTADNTRAEQLHINVAANIAVAIILLVSMLFGSTILNWFSISIDSFRIAGGIMIVVISLVMVQGQLERGRHNPDEKEEAQQKSSIAVVPLAMPLMAGPGAISSTIVFSGQFSQGLVGIVGSSVVIVAFAFTSFLIFLASHLMLKIMGTTGINIVTRIMGIIMMSIGIEMMASGIKGLFYVNEFLKYVAH